MSNGHRNQPMPAWTRLLLLILLALVLAIFQASRPLYTIGPNNLGETWCTKDGPVIRLAIEKFDDEAELYYTNIHEGIHALQCKRLGYLASLLHTTTPRLSLDKEAEAFASEYRARGVTAEQCTAITTIRLREDYENLKSLPTDTIRTVVAGWCYSLIESR